MKKMFFKEIKYSKSIAVLSVLIAHTTSFPISTLSMETFTFKIFFSANRLLHYAVSLFLVMSAFLEVQKFQKIVPFSIEQFYKEKIKRIAVPYVIWSFIYLLINHRGDWVFFRTGKWINVLIWGESSYHLYYLVIALQFYLIFPFAAAFLQKTKLGLWKGFFIPI